MTLDSLAVIWTIRIMAALVAVGAAWLLVQLVRACLETFTAWLELE